MKAIGFNYNLIDGTNYRESRNRGVKKTKSESEAEQTRPQDNTTSIVNKDKGRIIDVSL